MWGSTWHVARGGGGGGGGGQGYVPGEHLGILRQKLGEGSLNLM